MLQEFCRRLGIRATDAGIRDLVAALRELHVRSSAGDAAARGAGLPQEAALADALLHPQDRAYSVPQLFDFIEGAGLRFGRWIKQAPYSPQCGVMARLPQTTRLRELTMVEQYAAVELFRGTMVRHSVVAYRSDGRAGNGHVSFVDDGCLDYVPIRMPDTICVHDRLPPGAAAVLINRTHTHTDLFLAVNALEKRLFDAVDGSRRLGEIVEDVVARRCSAIRDGPPLLRAALAPRSHRDRRGIARPGGDNICHSTSSLRSVRRRRRRGSTCSRSRPARLATWIASTVSFSRKMRCIQTTV